MGLLLIFLLFRPAKAGAPAGECLLHPDYTGCDNAPGLALMPSKVIWLHLNAIPGLPISWGGKIMMMMMMAALAMLLESPGAAALLAGAWIARRGGLLGCESRVGSWFCPPKHHPGNFITGRELYPLFLLLAASLLVWRAKKPTPQRSFLSALGLGASLLFRSALFFLPPVLAVLDCVALRKTLSARGRMASLLIMATIPYLMLIPWVRMNWTLSHEFIPFEQGVDTSARSNIVTGALGMVHTVEGPWWTLASIAPHSGTWRVLGWAAGEVLRHPLRYLAAYAERLGFVLSLFPALIPLAALTLWSGRRKSEYQYLSAFVLYYIGVHCLMSVQTVYFMPLYPLLLALAAAGAARLMSAIGKAGGERLEGTGDGKGAWGRGYAKAKAAIGWRNVRRGWQGGLARARKYGEASAAGAVLGCLGLALLLSGYGWRKVDAYARFWASRPKTSAAGNLTDAAAHLLAANEYLREGRRGLADREIKKLLRGSSRFLCGLSERKWLKPEDIPEADRRAEAVLQAKCQSYKIRVLGGDALDLLPRKERLALEAECARVMNLMAKVDAKRSE